MKKLSLLIAVLFLLASANALAITKRPPKSVKANQTVETKAEEAKGDAATKEAEESAKDNKVEAEKKAEEEKAKA